MSKNKLRLLNPMKYWKVYFLISLFVIIPGVYSLTNYGLKLAIDFTGGSNITWQSEIEETQLRSIAQSENILIREVTQQGGSLLISTEPISREEYQDLVRAVRAQSPLTELQFETIGPALGEELVKKTLTAIILATFLILPYVATRFKSVKFGVSAVLAMLHDTLVLTGVFSLLGHFLGVEVDTLFVTALLTTLSFSVHDTIVVYDRIRELGKKHGYLDFKEIVNRAVVETMGRSLNNSLTIIFMLLSMYLLGGDSTKWFILALLVGAVSGTYSSTFTAAPLLLVWDRFFSKRLG